MKGEIEKLGSIDSRLPGTVQVQSEQNHPQQIDVSVLWAVIN